MNRGDDSKDKGKKRSNKSKKGKINGLDKSTGKKVPAVAKGEVANTVEDKAVGLPAVGEEANEKAGKGKAGKAGLLESPQEESRDEPDNFTKVYCCRLEKFVAGWQNELLKAKQTAQEETGVERAPFLISTLQDSTGIYAVICTRPCSPEDPQWGKAIPPVELMKRCVQKSFRAKSIEEGTFFSELQNFLKYALVNEHRP